MSHHVVQFGKGLKDHILSYQTTRESFQEVLDLLNDPLLESSTSLTRFSFANAAVLLDKTQFESIEQIESLANEFKKIGQSRKKKIAPYYATCLEVADYLRGYLTALNELKYASMSDAHCIREVTLREGAIKTVDALEVLYVSKEELAHLAVIHADQTHRNDAVKENKQSRVVTLSKILRNLFQGVSPRGLTPNPKTETEIRIEELRQVVASSSDTYNSFEMRAFLFSCGHKEQNFELVKQFFRLVDPDRPRSSFSKSTHLRLLIDTMHAIMKKNSADVVETQEYKDYLKHLCKTGITWLDSGREMPDHQKLAKHLRKISVRIGIGGEESEILADMSRGNREAMKA